MRDGAHRGTALAYPWMIAFQITPQIYFVVPITVGHLSVMSAAKSFDKLASQVGHPGHIIGMVLFPEGTASSAHVGL